MIRCETIKPGKRKPWVSMDWDDHQTESLSVINRLLFRWPKVTLTDQDGTRYVYTRVRETSGEYPPDVVTQRDRDNYDAAEQATWD